MEYEPKPHGDIDEGGTFINPWFNLIGWIVIILCVWYNQSYTVKEMTYKQPEYPWKKPMKIEMTSSRKCMVILKCLLIDMKDNPRITLGCSVFILYLFIRCFI